MNELKVNSSIFSVTGIIKQKANEINDGYNSDSVNGIEQMYSAAKYAEQQEEIKALLDKYKDLIIKDVEEVEASFQDIVQKDKVIADKAIALY